MLWKWQSQLTFDGFYLTWLAQPINKRNTHSNMSTLHITLSKRLKSFAEASTSSESKGFVDPGDYSLKALKQNFPNSDTDYAQIESTSLGTVWICSRWKETEYIVTHASPEIPVDNEPISLTDAAGLTANAGDLLQASFANASDAIDEQALVSLVKDYDGFSYISKGATYPYNLKGINIKVAPPAQNNCCTFVEGMAVKAWSDSFPDFEWNNKKHGQMMITGSDLFSPVAAALESGMGEEVTDVDAPPQPWTLIQGWKSLKTEITELRGGHTFFMVAYHEPTDKVLTLESNMAFKLNGVGFRQIGMASDFDHKPPANWWERPEVWTWAQIKDSFKFREMATLKVKNRSWAGV